MNILENSSTYWILISMYARSSYRGHSFIRHILYTRESCPSVQIANRLKKFQICITESISLEHIF